MAALSVIDKKRTSNKTNKVCGIIRNHISSGKYSRQLPGVTLLAKELGVNPLTVNKAFEQLENEGLVERISRKGTFIKGKKRIGFVILTSSSPDKRANERVPDILSGVLEGMHDSILDHSYTMLTHTVSKNDYKVIDQISSEVDGLIVYSAMYDQKDFVGLKDNIWIKIMGTADAPKDANHITYNNDEIGILAAEYLLKQECEKFYYFGGLNQLFRPRYENFCNRLSEASQVGDIIELDYAKLKLDVVMPLAKKRFEEIFSDKKSKIGLFLSSSSYAPLTYQLLYSMGITPMVDVEIITCENMRPILDTMMPQPAIIDLQMKKIGYQAVESLVKFPKHQNNSKYEKIIFSPEIIESNYNINN